MARLGVAFERRVSRVDEDWSRPELCRMASTTPSSHSLRLGRRHYPVTLPSVRDPRLGVAAVILSLQVLGQTVFGFNISIAQILTAIVTAAVLEVVITFGRRGVIEWPASALLTGAAWR